VAIAGRRYGVRLDNLQEVVRYSQLSVAPVPNSPEWLDGITSLRGSILSAVNLRSFLGLSRSSGVITDKASPGFVGFGRSSPRLLVVSTNDLTVGIIVDDIEGVIFVQSEHIQLLETYPTFQSDPALAYLDGIYLDLEHKREVALLNLRRLIVSTQMLKFEPAKI
jgi:chemotaxis signal transduction protein